VPFTLSTSAFHQAALVVCGLLISVPAWAQQPAERAAQVFAGVEAPLTFIHPTSHDYAIASRDLVPDGGVLFGARIMFGADRGIGVVVEGHREFGMFAYDLRDHAGRGFDRSISYRPRITFDEMLAMKITTRVRFLVGAAHRYRTHQTIARDFDPDTSSVHVSPGPMQSGWVRGLSFGVHVTLVQHRAAIDLIARAQAFSDRDNAPALSWSVAPGLAVRF
jgi:hypothetical protein